MPGCPLAQVAGQRIQWDRVGSRITRSKVVCGVAVVHFVKQVFSLIAKSVRRWGSGMPGSIVTHTVRRARSPPTCILFPVTTHSRLFRAVTIPLVPRRRSPHIELVSNPANVGERSTPLTLSMWTTDPVVTSRIVEICLRNSASFSGISARNTLPCIIRIMLASNVFPGPGRWRADRRHFVRRWYRFPQQRREQQAQVVRFVTRSNKVESRDHFVEQRGRCVDLLRCGILGNVGNVESRIRQVQ